MTLRIVPLTRDTANVLVRDWHRHHKPVQGYRFAIGVVDANGVLHGAAIIGRPVAPKTDAQAVAEITRLVTDGTRNACSILYGAAARAADAMGFDRIQTFILADEPGSSLKAAGYTFDGWTGSPVDGWQSRPGRENDAAQPQGDKQRWIRRFR